MRSTGTDLFEAEDIHGERIMVFELGWDSTV